MAVNKVYTEFDICPDDAIPKYVTFLISRHVMELGMSDQVYLPLSNTSPLCEVQCLLLLHYYSKQLGSQLRIAGTGQN